MAGNKWTISLLMAAAGLNSVNKPDREQVFFFSKEKLHKLVVAALRLMSLVFVTFSLDQVFFDRDKFI